MGDKVISRRDFVKIAAVGVAAAQFAPHLLANEIKKPLLRWGIIGTGHRARRHIPAIKMLSYMDVVAACDTDNSRLKLGLERIGKTVRTYTDYRKLLADPEVDAVLVCTPNCLHPDMVMDALKAGKYVMSEKPMAVSFDECKAMKQAEEASSKFVLYTLQLRYSYRYRELKKYVDSGIIGKPQYIFLPEYRGDWYTGDPWLYTIPETGEKINWRYWYAASGGSLSEKMCHYFDIINWIVGDTPEKILCNGGINHYKDKRNTWDHASVHLEYAGDVKALVSLCMYGPERLDPQIIGEKGSLHLMDDYVLFQGTGAAKGKTEKLPLTKEVGHGNGKGVETAVIRMYEEFYNCVQNNCRPFIGVGQAMAASKVAWLAELSAERNAQVLWDEIQ